MLSRKIIQGQVLECCLIAVQRFLKRTVGSDVAGARRTQVLWRRFMNCQQVQTHHDS